MRVKRLNARAVRDADVVAVTGADARKFHGAVGRGAHYGAPGGAEVRTQMRTQNTRYRVTAHGRKFTRHALHVQWHAHERTARNIAFGIVEIAAGVVVVETKEFGRFAVVIKLHGQQSAVAHETAFGELRFIDQPEGVAALQLADDVSIKVKG